METLGRCLLPVTLLEPSRTNPPPPGTPSSFLETVLSCPFPGATPSLPCIFVRVP